MYSRDESKFSYPKEVEDNKNYNEGQFFNPENVTRLTSTRNTTFLFVYFSQKVSFKCTRSHTHVCSLRHYSRHPRFLLN